MHLPRNLHVVYGELVNVSEESVAKLTGRDPLGKGTRIANGRGKREFKTAKQVVNAGISLHHEGKPAVIIVSMNEEGLYTGVYVKVDW